MPGWFKMSCKHHTQCIKLTAAAFWGWVLESSVTRRLCFLSKRGGSKSVWMLFCFHQSWNTSVLKTQCRQPFISFYFCQSAWLHLMFVSHTDWRGIRPGAVIQTNTWSCSSKLSISPPSLHIPLVPTFLSIWHLTALVKLHARENDVKPFVYGAYLITPSYSEDTTHYF